MPRVTVAMVTIFRKVSYITSRKGTFWKIITIVTDVDHSEVITEEP